MQGNGKPPDSEAVSLLRRQIIFPIFDGDYAILDDDSLIIRPMIDTSTQSKIILKFLTKIEVTRRTLQIRKFLEEADSLQRKNAFETAKALYEDIDIDTADPVELVHQLYHNKAVCFARLGLLDASLKCFFEVRK